MSMDKHVHLYKILVVGDVACGKTSIVKRYVHDIFSDQYKSTVGVDFALKILNLDDDTEVRLQMWDIAGQERFGSMTRVYYREAVGAFVVFDISRIGTLDGAAVWKDDLNEKVRWGPQNQPVPVYLLANKCDVPPETYCRAEEDIAKYAKSRGYIGYKLTSAKDNVGIEEAAEELVRHIMDNDPRNMQEVDHSIIIPSPEPVVQQQAAQQKSDCC
eukprot:TRINITY_DN3331_c0_g1_i1.p1 TRINITY_DN3331_c0_g1~~TRINITY_DN3331_c0_g1_i1.p1  ORF type:complete len:215 (+),score=68.12 TRINITY_DN3331_c0_g1_i1:95-739(+)